MLKLFFTLLFFAVLMLCISLKKTYTYVPAKELKRRAQTDDVARLLYRAVAYGTSLDILLWLAIGISASIFFLLLSVSVSPWLSLIISALTIWGGFALLPASRVTRFGAAVAKTLAPPLAWLLEHVHPLLQATHRLLLRLRPITVHTGLFTKEDLVELVNQQKLQIDNKISPQELEVIVHALRFGDMLVAEVMTPKRMIRSVGEDETIGPILMGELHDSGHSRFPVHQKQGEIYTGTLYAKDLLHARTGGSVKGIMKPDVYYVHEQQNLAEALQAFIKTKHHLFMVVNSFEEVVGLLTLEDVLEQIVGKPIVDEFDHYDDLRAVATRQAAKIHKVQKHENVIKSNVQQTVVANEVSEEKKEDPSENAQ